MAKAVKQSAGILLYRIVGKEPEFFLVHPGGPFWAKKDLGAWSISKGEFTDEEPLAAALREFEEETGVRLAYNGSVELASGESIAPGDIIELTPVKLKSGKKVYAWAIEGDIDADQVKSNVFSLEWPPRSGKMISVPEIDKAGWFSFATALEKINVSQAAFIHELAVTLAK